MDLIFSTEPKYGDEISISLNNDTNVIAKQLVKEI